MKQKSKEIERLFPLIGGNSKCDYRYGMFTSENLLFCCFCLSFSEHSYLYRLGSSPSLCVFADGRELHFDGYQNLTDSKTCWFFPIEDANLKVLADAIHIDRVAITRPNKTLLDLSSYEPEVWESFFQAAQAQCVNEINNTREYEDFLMKRIQVAIRLIIRQQLDMSKDTPERLLTLAENPKLQESISALLHEG